MKPYIDFSGKAKWSHFWGDKVNKKLRKIFKKSGRRENKIVTERELNSNKENFLG